MKDIKLIATDLDATFLRSDKSITNFTKNIVQKVCDDHILFVPCSARNYTCLPEWFLNHPNIKYLVASNGSVIVLNKTKETVHQAAISANDTLAILDATKDINPYWTVDTGDYLYASKAILDDHKKLGFKINDPNDLFIAPRTFVDDYREIIHKDTKVNKIHYVALERREELKAAFDHFPSVEVTSSHFRNFEIISKDAGKENALRKIMEMENIDPSQAVAFGDNDNDIKMIELVKYGVAVANAKDSLKAVAPYATLSNDEDGVATFIEQLLYK